MSHKKVPNIFVFIVSTEDSLSWCDVLLTLTLKEKEISFVMFPPNNVVVEY